MEISWISFPKQKWTQPYCRSQSLGDYNGNGTVDAADYVLWRNGGPLLNEVDTPGTVNAADYTEWRARFGNPSPGSGSGSGSSAVPEPATSALFVLGLAALQMNRRRRGR